MNLFVPVCLCVCTYVCYQAVAVASVSHLLRDEGLLQVRGAGAAHEEAARTLLL